MAKNKNKNRKKGGSVGSSDVKNAASVKDVVTPDAPAADEVVETLSTESIGDVLVVDESKPDERLDTISPVLDSSEERSESSEAVDAEPAVAATVE
jgi:hypothetical protein